MILLRTCVNAYWELRQCKLFANIIGIEDRVGYLIRLHYVYDSRHSIPCMSGSRKFCQKVSNSTPKTLFFKLTRGREDPNITKSVSRIGPLFKWRFAGGPIMAIQGMLARWLCDFPGDPDQFCPCTPPPPPPPPDSLMPCFPSLLFKNPQHPFWRE